jgi:hypothetical protein
MDIDMEYTPDENRLDGNPRLFVELSDSNTECIYLTITVTSELDPHLEFLVEHEEDSSVFRIGDHHRGCDMAIEIILQESEFTISLDPCYDFITKSLF